MPTYNVTVKTISAQGVTGTHALRQTGELTDILKGMRHTDNKTAYDLSFLIGDEGSPSVCVPVSDILSIVWEENDSED